ncbi:hypothetical protein E4T56_gene1760 [Termitomyces sp. T112]|nr:hypothetical protein E4T56_gene1760 [Termitomyces sp. T112]
MKFCTWTVTDSGLSLVSVKIPYTKGYHPAPPAALAPAPTDSAPVIPSAPIANKAPEPISCPATSALVTSTSNIEQIKAVFDHVI